MKLKLDIEWYNDILAMIESKWFEFYNKNIDYLLKEYEEEILKINPEKNVVKYTEHDLNRKLLGILRDIKSSPLHALQSMRAWVQTDEDSASKIQKVITTLKHKLGIGISE